MNDQTPTPSWRERMRPAELLILSGIFAVFVGGFVLMGTRTWGLALIMAGVTFVASLVVISTLLIAVKPQPGARVEPVDPDAATGTAGSVHRDPNKGARGY